MRVEQILLPRKRLRFSGFSRAAQITTTAIPLIVVTCSLTGTTNTALLRSVPNNLDAGRQASSQRGQHGWPNTTLKDSNK